MRSLVAVQAQDYAAGLWAVGNRLAAPSRAAVEAALADRTIIRTWPMRGTLHFVAAEDVRWLVGLLAPRILKRAAGRHRQLALDTKVFAKARALCEKHLAGTSLTRPELFAVFARAKIDPANNRGTHIVGTLAMERLLYIGAHRNKQPTYALLDECVAPSARDLAGDEAIAEVTRRYFLGHGPATADDLAWWTGFNQTEARRAVEMVRAELEVTKVGDATYYSGPLALAKPGMAQLLSAWDELTVAYRDRTASVDPKHAVTSQNGLSWCAAVDGKVVGLWRRDKGKVTIHPFGQLAPAAARSIARATERYERFVASVQP